MNTNDRLDHRLLMRLSRGICKKRTAAAPAAMPPDRLLIVRVDERVGNLVAMQGLVDTIKKAQPGLELGFLTTARMSPVVESLVGFDRLHRIDKRWFFRHPLRWRRVIGQVRSVGYQVAIDASAWHAFSYTHAALTYFSGAPVRIGYQRGADCPLHTHSVQPGPQDEYEGAQRNRLLQPLGMATTPARLRSTMGVQQTATWNQWLEQRQVAAPRVGVWPGSRKLNRRWPVSFFVKACRELQRQVGAQVVILWGPGEEALLDEMVFGLPQGAVMAPQTDLVNLAGLLRNLDLVITNDTGPMHLSVAVQTPTLAVFTKPEHTRWGHPYPQVRNVHLPGSDPQEVEKVVQAARDLLQKNSLD